MICLRRLIFCTVAVTTFAVPGFAPAQKQPFRPGLGDLMTAFVQPRHTKLGLAGQEQNWPYAAFELNELREAFDDVAQQVPKYRNLSIPDTIAATVKQPLATLDAAIKAKDAAGFTAGYAALTQSCNACHQSADRGVIAIQVPTVSAFPDQDFRPQKP
jgi:mono/diheme cytochrome c family protein